MNITDIRIRKLYTESRLRALVSITIAGDLAIHDIKVIQGPERLFVAMPSRRDETGAFRDICHPISPQARQQLEQAVLEAYAQAVQQPHTAPQPHASHPAPSRDDIRRTAGLPPEEDHPQASASIETTIGGHPPYQC